MNLIEDQVVLHGRRLNMRHEGVGLKSTLAFHRRVANEIEREVTHDGEVVRVMLGSDHWQRGHPCTSEDWPQPTSVADTSLFRLGIYRSVKNLLTCSAFP